MQDKKLGIILLVIVVLLLGFVFYVNISNVLDPLANPLVGEGLGGLCSNEEDCIDFCHNNRGQCNNYCQENPSNELCNVLFSVESNQNQEVNIQQIDGPENPPILKNLGFDIEPLDKQTNLAGDLVFTKDLLFDDGYISNDKVFVDFGHKDKYRTESIGNIEFWFFVPLETNAKAPVDGRVRIDYIEHSKDWSVSIEQNSEWIVSLEHLVDLQVNNGDEVRVGDILGRASPRNTFNSEIAMTELAVWTGGQNIYKYCPFDFLDESLKSVYEEKINRLANEWEDFVGRNIYEQENWVSPGCLKSKIKET